MALLHFIALEWQTHFYKSRIFVSTFYLRLSNILNYILVQFLTNGTFLTIWVIFEIVLLCPVKKVTLLYKLSDLGLLKRKQGMNEKGQLANLCCRNYCKILHNVSNTVIGPLTKITAFSR